MSQEEIEKKYKDMLEISNLTRVAFNVTPQRTNKDEWIRNERLTPIRNILREYLTLEKDQRKVLISMIEDLELSKS